MTAEVDFGTNVDGRTSEQITSPPISNLFDASADRMSASSKPNARTADDASDIDSNGWNPEDEHLRPDNDPERQGEVRYKRLPHHGTVPQRLYVSFFVQFIYLFTSFLRKRPVCVTSSARNCQVWQMVYANSRWMIAMLFRIIHTCF